jgi:rod shape-determining protein MreC
VFDHTEPGKSKTSAFVKRNRIVIVSLLILLFSLHLVLTDKRATHRGVLIKDILAVALSPVQNAMLGTYNAVSGVVNDYVFLVALKKENDSLKNTVQSLSQENNRLLEETRLGERLKETLDYKEDAPFETVVAGIRAFNMDLWSRTVTIDKGAGEGIKKDMAAITPMGVVGRVIEVNPHTSRVLLSTDPRSNIEAIVQRTRVKGVVEGNGADGLTLKYVRQLDDVTLGDRIVTSGFSGLFPKGLVIGEVTRIEKGADNFFKDIRVDPGVEFKKLEEVLLVAGPLTTEKGLAGDKAGH